MVFASDILAGRAGEPSTLRSLIADLKKGMEQRAAYRRTVRELSELSDNALADLGLSRSQIALIAREAIYGKNA